MRHWKVDRLASSIPGDPSSGFATFSPEYREKDVWHSIAIDRGPMMTALAR
jgi:hypothetical protein